MAGAPGWARPRREALTRFWDARIARQREIDASIAATAEHEPAAWSQSAHERIRGAQEQGRNREPHRDGLDRAP